MKQRLWLLQCCDAMCLLLREYCVGVSMAALSEQGPPVWMSYAQKRGLLNGFINLYIMRILLDEKIRGVHMFL